MKICAVSLSDLLVDWTFFKEMDFVFFNDVTKREFVQEF